MYFQHSLKKAEGFCPFMSAMKAITLSAPDGNPLQLTRLVVYTRLGLFAQKLSDFYESPQVHI